MQESNGGCLRISHGNSGKALQCRQWCLRLLGSILKKESLSVPLDKTTAGLSQLSRRGRAKPQGTANTTTARPAKASSLSSGPGPFSCRGLSAFCFRKATMSSCLGLLRSLAPTTPLSADELCSKLALLRPQHSFGKILVKAKVLNDLAKVGWA